MTKNLFVLSTCEAVLAIVLVSPLFSAQAQSTPLPESQATNASQATVPDSTKLQPIKTQKAIYPLQARDNGLQGEVMVEVHVSETGDVESAKAVSGDPILAEAAVSAAKKWKFQPFIKNGKPTKVAGNIPFDFFFSEKVMDRGRSADGAATSGANDPKIVPPKPSGTPAASADKDKSQAQNLPKRVRVSQGVSQGLLIRQISPVYPPQARANRVQGSVVLRAVIGKDGQLAELQPISGPEELIPAAVGAVQQWRYKPYYLMGQPVEVETQITINFTLR